MRPCLHRIFFFATIIVATNVANVRSEIASVGKARIARERNQCRPREKSEHVMIASTYVFCKSTKACEILAHSRDKQAVWRLNRGNSYFETELERAFSFTSRTAIWVYITFFCGKRKIFVRYLAVLAQERKSLSSLAKNLGRSISQLPK